MIDKYLQATALSVLFGTNQEQAINYMLKEAPSCEPYILNSIMELMIENEPDFKFVPASLLVPIVRECLREERKFNTIYYLRSKGYIFTYIRAHTKYSYKQSVNTLYTLTVDGA